MARRLACLSAIIAIFASPTAIAIANAEAPIEDSGLVNCAARTEIVSKLDQMFKESPQAVGVVNNQAVVEVFVSAEGTWTILATGTDGNSCVLSSGENWEAATLAAGKDA